MCLFLAPQTGSLKVATTLVSSPVLGAQGLSRREGTEML